MKKIIILTGDESRHEYFRKKLSNDPRFKVIASFCEGQERGLSARTFDNPQSSDLEKYHVLARTQAEKDFFAESSNLYKDLSNPVKLRKGDINQPEVVKQIISLAPDILICYGSSLIKSELLTMYAGRFLNVHLGLSPYYRGSGTNVWPLINLEPHMVGATFMHIDAGIDTGKIIHQIRPEIFIGDSAHSIGNRLIRKMANTYADLIAEFDYLTDEVQPTEKGKLYFIRHFDAAACAKLYENFRNGMIEKYLTNNLDIKHPYLVENKGLQNKVLI